MKKTKLTRHSIRRKPHKPYLQGTKDWCESWDSCWICHKGGVWPTTLDVHHLVGGSYRIADELSTTTMLCRRCHQVQHNSLAALGLHSMLAIKQHVDSENYSLERFCRARGRAGSFVTQAEVDEAKERLKL